MQSIIQHIKTLLIIAISITTSKNFNSTDKAYKTEEDANNGLFQSINIIKKEEEDDTTELEEPELSKDGTENSSCRTNVTKLLFCIILINVILKICISWISNIFYATKRNKIR
jgi:hypothetical protein